MGWEDPDPADVVRLVAPVDWDRLRSRYDPNLVGRPLERCLEVARAGGARTVVIEARYLDLDYRSEYSAFFSKTFAEIPDTTHRLHFFRDDIAADDLISLSAEATSGYLGYMILRPSPWAALGGLYLPLLPSCAARCMRPSQTRSASSASPCR